MIRNLLFSACFLIFSASLYAQPANDATCSAIALTVNSTWTGVCTNGTNTGSGIATDNPTVVQPSCWNGPSYNESVWYKFVATDDSITVAVYDGPATNLGGNTSLGVYSSSNGTCTGTFTEVGCAKQQSPVSLTGLTIGNTYWIMVDGNAGQDGNFCIEVYHTPPPPPPIGTCQNPRDLYPNTDCDNTQGLQFDNQNNIIWTNTAGGSSNDDAGLPSTYGNPEGLEGTGCADNDIGQNAYWVRFPATSAAGTVFLNNGSGSLDYAIFNGSGCPTQANYFDCYTIAGGSSATIGAGARPDLVVGNKYMVMITNTTGNNSTQRYLCIDGPNYVPPYDNCATPLVVTANVIYNLDNSNATADKSLCAGSMENNVWLKWTVPVSWTGLAYVHLFNQDCVAQNGLQLSIYTASNSCPGGTPTCEITLNPNNNFDFFGTFTPTPGSTYYITVDGYAGCACTFDFLINQSVVPIVVLPLDLVSFTAQKRSGAVTLNWITAAEMNNDYFTVEKSTDLINFSQVSRVRGAGFSSVSHAYNTVDPHPANGINYYRLKQTDYDGRSSYSHVVSVNCSNQLKDVVIFPNPADKTFHLKLDYPVENGQISIEVRDATGKLQKKYTRSVAAGQNEFVFPITDLPQGLYNVSISGASQHLTTKLLITRPTR
jgi:hypothetical protein